MCHGRLRVCGWRPALSQNKYREREGRGGGGGGGGGELVGSDETEVICFSAGASTQINMGDESYYISGWLPVHSALLPGYWSECVCVCVCVDVCEIQPQRKGPITVLYKEYFMNSLFSLSISSTE